jgi:phage baseplate assembly protein W
MIIEVVGESEAMDAGYIISAAEEIRRVLITRKGSIPMNPGYGSDLWKYRDRTPVGEAKLGIIAETYDAIETNVRRVRPTKVQVDGDSSGKWSLRIWIEEVKRVAA